MFYTCVQRFDVMGTVEFFLETKPNQTGSTNSVSIGDNSDMHALSGNKIKFIKSSMD